MKKIITILSLLCGIASAQPWYAVMVDEDGYIAYPTNGIINGVLFTNVQVIADSGAYYTGTDTETALQEIGASGVLTAFTEGSIIFMGSSALTQDNSNLFWDDTNKRLGIGTANPMVDLHLYTATGTAIQRLESDDSAAGIMQVQLYNDGNKELSAGKLGTAVNFFGLGSGAILNRDGNMNIISDGNDPIIFYTDVTDAQSLAATEKMRLAADGELILVGDTISIRTSKTPASAAATGLPGEIVWDTDYIYICVGTNTWKRAAISTW